MTECIECKTLEGNQYFMLSTGEFICHSCFSRGKPDQKPTNKQHLPMFTKWKCLKHNCHSYNFNMLGRHEMPWCEIITEVTVGIVKPKTSGGLNGNLGKHYFPDWIEYVQKNDMEIHAIKSWQKFTKTIPSKKKKEYSSKNKYNKRKKHANRFKTILQVT